MKFNQKFMIPLAAVMIAGSAVTGLAAVASADTTTATTQSTMQHARPAAMGKVTAIHGNTLTVTDMKSNTTYTVDVSSATITKHQKPAAGAVPAAPTTITVSGIAVGDMVAVEGAVNGTSITATAVHDGMGGGMGGHGRGLGVGGTVTSVNGSTITITGMDGKTYTVNATGTTVSKMTTINVSDIAVGDKIGVHGTVNGTNVTAKHIMDGMPEPKDAPGDGPQ